MHTATAWVSTQPSHNGGVDALDPTASSLVSWKMYNRLSTPTDTTNFCTLAGPWPVDGEIMRSTHTICVTSLNLAVAPDRFFPNRALNSLNSRLSTAP